MKLIHGGRQSGKTINAIREAALLGAYLVVRNHAEAVRVHRIAERENLKIPFPITFDEFANGSFSTHGVRGFVVDGAEALISRMARGVPVHVATFEDEEEVK